MWYRYTKRVASIYSLKPKFQALLRPIAGGLARAGVTANQVTLTACVLSIALGVLLVWNRGLLLLLPVFLFVRMALNAIDGMLAREFGQKSNLGAYLNELSDVVSDACLYLPFAYMPEFSPIAIGSIIVLAAISEMTGTVAVMTGASRRYDGPMGKSDRAFFFGALALYLGLGGNVVPWASWSLQGAVALLLIVTIVNRVKHGLAETNAAHARSAGR